MIQANSKFLAIAIAIIVFTTACGVFSGFYFGKAYSCNIYTADIKKIADDKKTEIVKKFQQDKDNPNASAMLEKEYADFLKRMDKVLDAYKKADKKALILRKEAVIEGNYTDITEEIRAIVNKKEEAKVEDKKG